MSRLVSSWFFFSSQGFEPNFDHAVKNSRLYHEGDRGLIIHHFRVRVETCGKFI